MAPAKFVYQLVEGKLVRRTVLKETAKFWVVDFGGGSRTLVRKDKFGFGLDPEELWAAELHSAEVAREFAQENVEHALQRLRVARKAMARLNTAKEER